ncbi:MAG: hypothetical protein JNL82_09690 [Myxococcales bacterium]|jgi:hypothetical protein|nr:hypothetical protein [Myxococcales bacterium]
MPERVNPQIIDAINSSQLATMSPQVVKTSGAGKAYQSVAQSTAIAVQDAADNLRNVGLISSTAAGVALSQMLATGETTPYTEVLTQAQTLMQSAVTNFATIGQSAAQILREFPSG